MSTSKLRCLCALTKTPTNIFHFTLSCLRVSRDGVRAHAVFCCFWSPPGSPRAQGPEGRAVHSSAGDHQPTQGTSGAPRSHSCPVWLFRHMMESKFFLYSDGHIPRGPLWFCVGFERQLLLSVVAVKFIWCPREKIWTLISKECQPIGGLQRHCTWQRKGFPSLFNDYLCIMHGKILFFATGLSIEWFWLLLAPFL